MRLAAASLSWAFLLTVCAPASGSAQATSDAPGLSVFEGHYEYRDGLTLYMVDRGADLVAVIGEGKYTLRAAGVDRFTNASGDTIPFLRDEAGEVVAFGEHGLTFARLSADVPASVRRLFAPRPPGPDGVPVAYRYEPPIQLGDGIPIGVAGSETLPVDVAVRLVQGVITGEYPDVRAVLVHHHGVLRLEEYFYGYDRHRPHEMRSLTKSVIAMLAGAAIDRGLLAPDEPVLERLGYTAVANPDPRKERITLTDLLSMRSGLACDDYDGASPGNEVTIYDTEDWVRAFVDLPAVADPGTVAHYCTAGILAAGRMVERATGLSLPAFAQEVLFGPLGIRAGDWIWDFRLTREQRNDFGLHLRPRDMLKLGLLLRERGEWQGRRVLAATWIDDMTARQSRIGDSDYGLGLWHRWYNVRTSDGNRRVDTIMLSGNGGQKIYVVPSLDLVAVFTGGSFNSESPANEMMAGVILPALIDQPGP